MKFQAVAEKTAKDARGLLYFAAPGSDLKSQPKRPGDLDLWPFDLKSGARVTCDVGYLHANFSLPRPLCSRLRPDVRDRQTDRRQTL